MCNISRFTVLFCERGGLHCFCECLGCEDSPTSVTSYMIKASRSWIYVHLSCQLVGLSDFDVEIAKSLVPGVWTHFSAFVWAVLIGLLELLYDV